MKSEKEVLARRNSLVGTFPIDVGKGLEQEAFLMGVVRGTMISAMNWVLEVGEIKKKGKGN